MSELALGIDVGTTAVKAVVLDRDGRVVADASAAHDLSAPHPGWAEADPARWWENVVACIRALGSAVALGDIAVVGVSGMVPTLVLLDAGGRILRPSIQQNDARTGAELRWLAERLDGAALFETTGQPWSQQLVAPRMLWLSRHEPAVHSRIRHVLGSYDYVTHRLTGAWSLEQNWALESGLWDARRRCWLTPVLEAARLDEAWLPPVRSPHEVVGGVSSSVAAEAGLPPGTPVIAGSADHVAAALAAGTGSGDLALKIGGAGDILYGLDRFAPDPRLYIDHHDVPGQYLLNGCMAASGSLVKWLAGISARELGATAEAYARLDAEAAAVPAGSDGLVILPYFLGEKTPILDPSARGACVGLTLHHGRGHLHRAVLEAVAYAFRHHVDVLDEGGHRIRSIRVMDGGARSPLWRQIISDVLGRSLRYAPGAARGSAHGVAIVAGAAVGSWGWQGPPAVDAGEEVHEPDPAAADRYRALYRIYRDLYSHLRGDFAALARVQ